MGKLAVVVGGMYGSESKGAVTAWIARRDAQDRGRDVTVVRVAGPNAGHTAYDAEGGKWALRQVPAAVVVPQARLVIGAGSEIDPDVLLGEVEKLEAAGIKVRDRLLVDEQATVIEQHHYNTEADANLVNRIGSTGKGVGAARADRIMRRAKVARDDERLTGELHVMPNTASLMNEFLASANSTVVIEGTQGYGLGMHAGHYPQSTSSDCRAIDFMSMAGIDRSWADEYQVWVVVRTYPIRVAGNSGPMLNETTWEDLGLEPEKTTVTQKIRRVGRWDPDLVHRAVEANGGPSVVRLALAMVDYVVPELAGVDGDAVRAAGHASDQVWGDLIDLITNVENDSGAVVSYVGTSGSTCIEWE